MSQIIFEPRDTPFSMSYCGAGSQMLAGAFVGAIAGYIVAIVIGRDETTGSVAGAFVGAVLLTTLGC